MAENNDKAFDEIITICDESDWVWTLVKGRLDAMNLQHVRVPSSTPFRQSWNRFKNAQRIIIYWENKFRSGGAIIEEIIDVSPVFDISENVIVITSNPTHEDVVYFSELGVRRIVKLRNRDKELEQAGREIIHHVTVGAPEDKTEATWRKILRAIDHLTVEAPAERVTRYKETINSLQSGKEETARYLDAAASIAYFQNEPALAQTLWEKALDKNPNYYRSYNNLIHFFQKTGKLQESFALMQKMQELNKSSISRLVNMGEIHVEMGDDERGEHYFNSALTRDNYCSGALNGLAEMRFRQGDLDASRKLLARSNLAYKVAATLNKRGIEMVQKGKYKDALDHYTKAQYVIPQQEKSPMLFFNIGLCYYRWGKHDLASEFLKIALIKEPNYKKAQRLIEKINGTDSSEAA